MSVSYFMGLDLGQARDYSALAVVEAEGYGPERVCSVRHLQRWRLETSYPTICVDTTALLGREPLTSAPLVIDATGVGRPVVEMLNDTIPSRRLHAVTITGGSVETKDDKDSSRVIYWTVPKRVLVSTIQVLLQSKRLKIAPELADAQTLVGELENFQVTITEAANDTYGGRQGAHDDLVLAVALSCWGALHKSLHGPMGVLAMGKAKRKPPVFGGGALGDGEGSGGIWSRKIVRG